MVDKKFKLTKEIKKEKEYEEEVNNIDTKVDSNKRQEMNKNKKDRGEYCEHFKHISKSQTKKGFGRCNLRNENIFLSECEKCGCKLFNTGYYYNIDTEEQPLWCNNCGEEQ